MNESNTVFTKVEISPVFPLNIDISKSDVVKLVHKEYFKSVEQKGPKINWSWLRYLRLLLSANEQNYSSNINIQRRAISSSDQNGLMVTPEE